MTLSAKHTRHFERRLNQLRAILVHRAQLHDQVATETSLSREDQNDDLASTSSLEEFALGVYARDFEALKEIDAAIDKIEYGIFGECEMCGHGISRARLEAIPYVRYCIDCATAAADPLADRSRQGEAFETSAWARVQRSRKSHNAMDRLTDLR